MGSVVVVTGETGGPRLALGPFASESDAETARDRLRLPHGWASKVVPLREPELVDVRAQVRARRGD